MVDDREMKAVVAIYHVAAAAGGGTLDRLPCTRQAGSGQRRHGSKGSVQPNSATPNGGERAAHQWALNPTSGVVARASTSRVRRGKLPLL